MNMEYIFIYLDLNFFQQCFKIIFRVYIWYFLCYVYSELSYYFDDIVS